MSETLTEKHGGVPTFVWLLGGVGVLVVIMFLRNKQATSNNAVQSAANGGGALQTNVLSPSVAASLTQGAAPMSYSGGDIYNNVAVSGGTAPTSTPTPTPIAPLEPGTIINIPTNTNMSGKMTLAQLATLWGTSAQAIEQNNPGYSAASKQINIPYTVKAGDTWATLAQKDQIGALHLMQNNGAYLGAGGNPTTGTGALANT